MNNRIYISGDSINNPDIFKFGKAHVALREQGFAVIDPVYSTSRLPEDLSYQEHIKINLALLDLCDSIYLLKGWEASIEASCEYSYAQAMGKKIIFESEGMKGGKG